MPINRNNWKPIGWAYYRQLSIIFFHYQLLEILFLETWAKGHILKINETYKLTLVMLNKLRCYAHFSFSTNQFTWLGLMQIQILNGKQCRSRSVGFWRTYLDLHCLQRQGISGLSRTRVMSIMKDLLTRNMAAKSALSWNNLYLKLP